MSTQEPESQTSRDRAHIWSINVSVWPFFVTPVILLIGIFIIGSGCSIYQTYNDPSNKEGLWSLILTSFKDIGPIGLSSAIIGYILAGGIEMAKSYLEYRQEKRREAERRANEARRQVEEREKRAYEKGLEEGRKQAQSNS